MAIFTAEEIERDARSLLAALAIAITPAPEMPISQWAEGRVNIPGETGTSRPGKLSWDGFEYLIEPLDRLGPEDPARDVPYLGSAQIAKTTVGIIATMYYSAAVPRPWCVALPSIEERGKYNRTKWQPIVDDTPELRRKIRAVSSRDEQGSTSDYKRFAGGYGQFVAVGSPKALQMMSYCLIVKEETPNWDREVGARGDPHGQLKFRQLQWEQAGAKTFHNSTPGVVRRSEEEGRKGELVGCPITEDFNRSDQRRLYMPCPACGDRPDGVLLVLAKEQLLGQGVGETPHFVCPDCGGVIEHRHKADMVRRCHPYRREPGRQHGGWLPTFVSANPENPAPGWWIKAADFDRWRARDTEGRQPGYFSWQIVSSAVDWRFIAAEHRAAETGSEAAKITCSQQVDGEAYELTLETTSVEELMERRETRLKKGVVPSGYELLTLAFDLNGDWAQWTVYGWGPDGEHVPVDKGRVEGTPNDPQLWVQVSELMRRKWPHEDGGEIGIEAGGIDTGYGTFHVYQFCSLNAHVKALDGRDGWGRMPLKRGKKQALQGKDGTKVRCRIWEVGTWDLKRFLLHEAIPASVSGEAAARGPNKPHWPGWLMKDFFEELTAEALVEVQEKKTGVVKAHQWVRIRRRNEELDLYVYNVALARSVGVGVTGAEPDWIELARRRTGRQHDLQDLWERPTAHAVREAEPADAGWGWKKG